MARHGSQYNQRYQTRLYFHDHLLWNSHQLSYFIQVRGKGRTKGRTKGRANSTLGNACTSGGESSHHRKDESHAVPGHGMTCPEFKDVTSLQCTLSSMLASAASSLAVQGSVIVMNTELVAFYRLSVCLQWLFGVLDACSL